MWDHNMPEEIDIYSLAKKACKKQLSTSEEDTLIEVIKFYPEMVDELGLSQDVVPNLVAFCPRLALQVFISLNNDPAIYWFFSLIIRHRYYTQLTKLSLDKNTKLFIMELKKNINVPMAFIQYFVANELDYLILMEVKNVQTCSE